MSPRKVCVITGTRAEFGLLKPLMKEIAADPELVLQVVAAGMHLSPEFGLTYRVIELEGFTLDDKVEMLLSSDSPEGIAKSIGLGTIGFSTTFRRLAPNLVVVLGDRFEVLAAVQAALVARIPVAHIHGGEATEGLIDEPIRHAVTKMSHLHFTATEIYRRRVIQLGEDPARVFNVGTPGLDDIDQLTHFTLSQLETKLGLTLRRPTFVVTYHPVTLEHGGSAEGMAELLAALDTFSEASIVFTMPNADTYGRTIIEAIDDYVERHQDRTIAHTSLGRECYLNLVKFADAVVGNSSSGLIEAPSFGTPTVNIGDRQRGRLRAASVIDCPCERGTITAAIEKALSPAFRNMLSGVENPYGAGNASRKIKDVIKRTDLAGIVKKRFYDLN